MMAILKNRWLRIACQTVVANVALTPICAAIVHQMQLAALGSYAVDSGVTYVWIIAQGLLGGRGFI